MEKRRLKALRTAFREGVLVRDGHLCVVCGRPAVDAHHITDRSLMPNGGYAIPNGISLCDADHFRAELFNISGGMWWLKGYGPNDLYALVSSSYSVALAASEALGAVF